MRELPKRFVNCYLPVPETLEELEQFQSYIKDYDWNTRDKAEDNLTRMATLRMREKLNDTKEEIVLDMVENLQWWPKGIQADIDLWGKRGSENVSIPITDIFPRRETLGIPVKPERFILDQHEVTKYLGYREGLMEEDRMEADSLLVQLATQKLGRELSSNSSFRISRAVNRGLLSVNILDIFTNRPNIRYSLIVGTGFEDAISRRRVFSDA